MDSLDGDKHLLLSKDARDEYKTSAVPSGTDNNNVANAYSSVSTPIWSSASSVSSVSSQPSSPLSSPKTMLHSLEQKLLSAQSFQQKTALVPLGEEGLKLKDAYEESSNLRQPSCAGMPYYSQDVGAPPTKHVLEYPSFVQRGDQTKALPSLAQVTDRTGSNTVFGTQGTETGGKAVGTEIQGTESPAPAQSEGKENRVEAQGTNPKVLPPFPHSFYGVPQIPPGGMRMPPMLPHGMQMPPGSMQMPHMYPGGIQVPPGGMQMPIGIPMQMPPGMQMPYPMHPHMYGAMMNPQQMHMMPHHFIMFPHSIPVGDNGVSGAPDGTPVSASGDGNMQQMYMYNSMYAFPRGPPQAAAENRSQPAKEEKVKCIADVEAAKKIVVTATENTPSLLRSRGTYRDRSAKSYSRFRGVYLKPNGKWRAQLSIGGKKQYIGTFDSEVAAARAWDTASLALGRKFRNLPPTEDEVEDADLRQGGETINHKDIVKDGDELDQQKAMGHKRYLSEDATLAGHEEHPSKRLAMAGQTLFHLSDVACELESRSLPLPSSSSSQLTNSVDVPLSSNPPSVVDDDAQSSTAAPDHASCHKLSADGTESNTICQRDV